MIINQDYKLVPIADIKPHPSNPRIGDLATIEESIDVNGFYGALVVNKRTGHILAGNHRYKAAVAQKLAELPVIYVEVSDDAALRIMAADNRTSDLGGYDEEALATLLDGLEGLQGTGYSLDDLNSLLDSMEVLGDEEEDSEPQMDRADELAQEWKTERGQVWLVGPHRLMCGDCTSTHDVDILMNGQTADLLLTDPPYGVSYAAKNEYLKSIGRQSRALPIDGDQCTVDETRALWSSAFGEATRVLKDGGCFYSTGPSGGDLMPPLMMTIQEAGLLLKHVLIWVKDRLVFGRCDYHYRHEPIFYGWKPGKAHYFGGDTTSTSVWEFNKPSASKLHPTTKPVELWTRAVVNGSRRHEIVYDPFHGSGTTAIACHNTERVCYGMEISPGYLAVQLERLKDLGLSPGLA